MVNVTGILDVDWVPALSLAGGATLLSVLTSVSAGAANPGTGPSLGTETPTGAVAAKEEADGDLVAGPAADIVEGAPVQVVPDDSGIVRNERGQFARDADGEGKADSA